MASDVIWKCTNTTANMTQMMTSSQMQNLEERQQKDAEEQSVYNVKLLISLAWCYLVSYTVNVNNHSNLTRMNCLTTRSLMLLTTVV